MKLLIVDDSALMRRQLGGRGQRAFPVDDGVDRALFQAHRREHEAG